MNLTFNKSCYHVFKTQHTCATCENEPLQVQDVHAFFVGQTRFQIFYEQLYSVEPFPLIGRIIEHSMIQIEKVTSFSCYMSFQKKKKVATCDVTHNLSKDTCIRLCTLLVLSQKNKNKKLAILFNFIFTFD